MGVQGLWKLLEPAGRPVALETLQGKVLAVGEADTALRCSPVCSTTDDHFKLRIYVTWFGFYHKISTILTFYYGLRREFTVSSPLWSWEGVCWLVFD